MSLTIPSESSQASEKGRDNMRKKGKGRKRDNLAHPAQLNPVYHKQDVKECISSSFRAQQPTEHAGTKASLIVEPFSVCTLPNLVKDEQFLEGLKYELLDQIFYEKNNDLYTFQQSDDLKKISTPHVRALRKLLYEDVLEWVKDVTGIPLTDTVDMTCSRYDYTDILLCHDDELAGRRIAFILYLTPPWKVEDGGMLDLFNMDEHNQPKDVVHSILPRWNNLVWFEVTHASHHQVAEVLTEDKTRVSVGGWFHGPSVPRPKPYIESPLPLKTHLFMDEDELYEWINPIYLDLEVQGQIQERFENDSEIELQGFLKEDKYQEVMKALQDGDIDWKVRGPANKRHFDTVSEENVPEVVQQCLKFLQSEAMFLTLSNLTGLSLHALAAPDDSSDDNSQETTSSTLDAPPGEPDGHREEPEEEMMEHSGSESEVTQDRSKPRKKRRKLNTEGSDNEESKLEEQKKERNPRCRGEVRRWGHGSYTLVHDTDVEGCQYALDAMLFFSCKGWQPQYGGFTSYIAKGEDEELLTVNPSENSLALVYRDKDTLRFVKYLNDRVKDMPNGQEFYDFSLCYFE